MEQNKKPKNPAWTIIFWTLIFSLGYAILRYHIAGPVPWKDLPFFVLNKGNALSAFILLAINFSLGPLKKLGVAIPGSWLRSRKLLGIMGFLQAFVHVIMSFILLRPTIYEKFFAEDGSLTLYTGLNLLGGISAFIFLWIYNISFNME
jgi:DMSO/TMAO reductase YedYZ heme-binding membrane subunit